MVNLGGKTMDKYVDVDFALCATDGKHYDSGKL